MQRGCSVCEISDNVVRQCQTCWWCKIDLDSETLDYQSDPRTHQLLLTVPENQLLLDHICYYALDPSTLRRSERYQDRVTNELRRHDFRRLGTFSA